MNHNFTVNTEATGDNVFLVFPGIGWREMVLAADGTIPIGCNTPHEVFWCKHNAPPFNEPILYLLDYKKSVTAMLRQSIHDTDAWHGSWMFRNLVRSIHIIHTKKKSTISKVSSYSKEMFINADGSANIPALQNIVTDVICEENGYCKGFHAAQSGSEVSGMFAKLIEKGVSVKRFLEIGTCDGGMFVMLLFFFRAFFKDTVGVSMDIKQKEMLPSILQEDALVHFHNVNTRSSKAVNVIQNEEPFDFSFIDGDHSYEGVKNDFELVINKSKHVAFHDICFSPGVIKFWNEVKEKYKSEFEFFEFKGSRSIFKDPVHLINGNVSTIGIGLMLRK